MSRLMHCILCLRTYGPNLVIGVVFLLIVVPKSLAISVTSLTIDNGLKTNTVTAIVQDKEGFMWIGSLNGLSRYDGYQLIHFRHEPDNPHSLSNNHITNLIVDQRGTLWVSTFNGLNRYDDSQLQFERYSYTQMSYSGGGRPRKSFITLGNNHLWFAHYDSLYRYRYETDALEAIDYSTSSNEFFSEDHITAILEDNEGKIWIALNLSGLKVFDPKTRELRSIQLQSKAKEGHQTSPYEEIKIITMLQDADSTIWIGTDKNGLFAIDKDGRIENLPFDAGKQDSLSHRSINTLFIDDQDLLWVGTSAGLAEKQKFKRKFFTYRFQPAKRRGLTNDNIKDIYQDRSGLIWIGTQTGGVNIYNPATEFFHHETVNENDTSTLSNKVIRGMVEDHLGYIWIGTHNGGVNRLDIENSEYKHYRYETNNPETIPNDRVSAVYEDNDKDLWATTLKGIAKYNRDKDIFERVFNHPNDPNKLTITQPISIIQDRDSYLWIGTRRSGLIRYNKETGQHKKYVHNRADVHSLSFNGIRPLMEDSKGYIWVGTRNGLNRLDKSTDLFTQYHHDPTNGRTLSDQYIYALHEDKSGVIWIGTGDGLNRFHRNGDYFTHYTKANGLPNNSIYGILEDQEKQHLWLSTNYGLSQLDTKTMTFRNYDVSHGLQSYEFNPPSALKTRSGLMFFGGIDGFNFFHPRAIRNNPYKPRTILTAIESIDKKRLPKNKPIHQINVLELEHTDQVISFQFSALDYTYSIRNEYRYKLEGFDPNWIDGGTKNFVTYTNLDPGTYTFQVQGSNSDGVWSENTAQLDLVVHPAPWATIWANIAYATIFMVLALYYIYRHRKELAKERDVAAKLREVSALKDQFLATTSHELRTPMNGVIGTASLLTETSLSVEQREYVDLIRISSENLLSIINDILDFSRIEAGKVDLENRYFSLSQLLEEVLDIFAVQAQKNGIEMIYTATSSLSDNIYADSTRLRQVLINLIGNALKFTKKGEIIVTATPKVDDKNNHYLLFTITDTGIGIPDDKMSRLFEAFTQVDASTTRRFGGTGLGLAISRRLVELMGGKINVRSKVNEGTCFSFTVPHVVSNEHNPKPLVNHLFKRQQVLLCHENNAIAEVIVNNLQQWRLNVTHYNYYEQDIDQVKILKPSLLLINHNKVVSDNQQIKLLLDRFENLPVIFLSTLSNEELMSIYQLHTFEVKSPIKWQRLYAMCSALLQISDFKPQRANQANNHVQLNLASEFPATILIAEDNPINQRIAHQMLIRLGYQDIDIVNNGLEAVEATRNKHYDIILMDVQMPEMDGLDATQLIVANRNEDLNQRIIALTANAMEGDKEKCLIAGMDSYMSKPVKMSELREQLSRIMQNNRHIAEIQS